MIMSVEKIALVCHEANAAYCEMNGEPIQPAWDELTEETRKSIINGVWFHLANPAAKPKDSHDKWMKDKALAGWKYGLAKDPVLKEHPCMVEFKNLPPHQQAKDLLFKNIVQALRGFLV